MKEVGLSDSELQQPDKPKYSLVGYLEVGKDFDVGSLNNGEWECINVTPVKNVISEDDED